MSSSQEASSHKFYVYQHIHPESKQVVYVGKGTAGRAWSCGFSSGAIHGRGNRTKEHQTWIHALLNSGYTPADFVVIVAQGLDGTSAREIETELTEECRVGGAPLFNIMCYGVEKNAVLSPEQRIQAVDLRTKGLSYAKIARQIGVSTMTVWRALHGKTKAYREAAHA
jgi:hypothetical protein